MNLRNILRGKHNNFPVQRKEGSVVAWLSPGDYTANGSVSLPPILGNYTPTSALSDGSAGDTTTGVTSTGATLTIVHVFASVTAFTTWAITAFYKGGMVATFTYWDGSAWQSMTDGGTGWMIHISYTSQTKNCTFSESAIAIRAVMTESDTSGGNTKVTDARVS